MSPQSVNALGDRRTPNTPKAGLTIGPAETKRKQHAREATGKQQKQQLLPNEQGQEQEKEKARKEQKEKTRKERAKAKTKAKVKKQLQRP